MTDDSDEIAVFSFKAPISLRNSVDRFVREHPEAFKDRSSFLFKATVKMLRDCRQIGSSPKVEPKAKPDEITADDLLRLFPGMEAEKREKDPDEGLERGLFGELGPNREEAHRPVEDFIPEDEDLSRGFFGRRRKG